MYISWETRFEITPRLYIENFLQKFSARDFFNNFLFWFLFRFLTIFFLLSPTVIIFFLLRDIKTFYFVFLLREVEKKKYFLVWGKKYSRNANCLRCILFKRWTQSKMFCWARERKCSKYSFCLVYEHGARQKQQTHNTSEWERERKNSHTKVSESCVELYIVA